MFENSKNNSPNLGQGSSFNSYQNKIKETEITGVEKTTKDNLGSITEGLGKSNMEQNLFNYDDAIINYSKHLRINTDDFTSSELQEHIRDLQTAKDNYISQSQRVTNDSETLITDIVRISSKGDKLISGITDEKQKQRNYNQAFKNSGINAENLNDNMQTINAKQSDSRMRVNSYGMQYLLYIILLITIISVTTTAITAGEESRIVNIVILLIALVLVFLLARWLHDKINNKLF
tara:strand:- start:184 stop:885 length:702 start_codon:yes stop_codon:yes gene_type:complete